METLRRLGGGNPVQARNNRERHERTPAMRKNLRCLLPMFLLAACGSHHVLTGGWAQVTPDGKVGVFLEFDDAGTKIHVHGAPRPEGGHDDLDATFTFDAATKAMTIECALLGDGKATTWKGSLNGDVLDLSSADGKLTFRRGGHAQGH
jgi:hypothetical protein